jgi:hypothetical protein
MKLPNPRRLANLTALAVLLAGISTGCLTVCERFLLFLQLGIFPGPLEEVTLEAGDTFEDWADALDFLSMFALCDSVPVRGSTIPAGESYSVPPGVYVRTNRDLRGPAPSATVDLVTSASTPPGRYIVQYRDISPSGHVVGTLDLTVQPASHPLVEACVYVYQDGEYILTGQPANFYGCCSQAPEEDPIVQYRWWWDYKGSPTPDATTTTCITTHTYSTPGTKTARLVVRTQSGEEDDDTMTIVVQNP